MRKEIQIAVFSKLVNSDKVKRAKRKNGGSRKNGGKHGQLSKANGFRP